MSEKYSIIQFTGNGSTRAFTFNFAGGYVNEADVKVYLVINGIKTTPTFTFTAVNKITLTTAPPLGSTLMIVRETEKRYPLTDFTDGAVLDEASLNTMAKQAIFAAAEVADQAGFANDNVAAIFTRVDALEDEIGTGSKGTQAFDLATQALDKLTRTPQLPSSTSEAALLSGYIPKVNSAGKWTFGLPATGGGGGSVSLNNPRYPSDGHLWTGLTVDGVTGELYDSNFRDVWLDQFYTSETDTDTQAFLNFAAWFTTAGDVRLQVRAGRGRGPSGRYLVEQEIVLTSPNQRLVLDFGEATIRYTTSNSRFRYKSPQPGVPQGAALTNFFIVRGGVHQYAAIIDGLFYWDFTYIPSRSYGTGYIENVRIQPQTSTSSAHQLLSAIRCKNTWMFRVVNCHVNGANPSSTQTPASVTPGSAFLRQEQLCIVTVVDKCEVSEFDKAVELGQCPLLLVNGTLSGGTMGRGKMIRQGTATAFLGGTNVGYQGTTYGHSFYDESGTFAPGPCDVVDGNGVVTGTYTINALARATQLGEAVQVHGGSTFVNVNYFINATQPANAINKWLNCGMNDTHVAYMQGCIKIDGIADLQIGTGTFLIGSLAGLTCFDIANGDLVNICGMNATTNGLGGTFLKLRNVTSGQMLGCGINFYGTPWDFDNTVKSFTVQGTTGYELGQSFTPIMTAKRYNALNTRGVRFRNNGLMGAGLDTDDNRRQSWTPVIQCSSGTLASVSLRHAYFTLCNGVLTFSFLAKIDPGTAAGSLFVSAPKLPGLAGPINIPDEFSVHASVGNSPAVAVYDPMLGRFEIVNADAANTVQSAFKIRDTQLGGPLNAYYITGSIPVQFD